MDILNVNLQILATKGVDMLVNVVIALLIFWIGKMIAKKITNILKNMMQKSKLDATLINFLGNIIFGVLMLVVIMAALGKLGVNTTSIVAIMGGATVAVGLALQDQLANFAAGVLIILFRPFNKGDYVDINGKEGTVHDISLISTSLKTVHNHEIVIPNSQITANAVTNYTSMPNRRVDLTIGIGYGANIKQAKDIMLDIAKNHELVFSDPAPNVMVTTLNDSSVDLLLCIWASNADWLKVKCDLYEEIKYAFDEHGIEIPFPQQVVHMISSQS